MAPVDLDGREERLQGQRTDPGNRKARPSRPGLGRDIAELVSKLVGHLPGGMVKVYKASLRWEHGRPVLEQMGSEFRLGPDEESAVHIVDAGQAVTLTEYQRGRVVRTVSTPKPQP